MNATTTTTETDPVVDAVLEPKAFDVDVASPLSTS
jgi:hypothetical protein